MELYPLHELVHVRTLREDRAKQAVNVALRKVEEAKANLENRKKDLEEYRAWRIQEEERKLASLIGQVMKVGAVTDVRLEISSMREKEFDYVDAIRKAEADLEQAQKALAEAREFHKKALQELMKLEEHREVWKQEQSVEQERLADLEMEEFRVRRN